MTDSKHQILRMLAQAGEELRQHRHRYGRESDERLRAKLAAAGLTPEMAEFLVSLADKAEAERQKQRDKREGLRPGRSRHGMNDAQLQNVVGPAG